MVLPPIKRQQHQYRGVGVVRRTETNVNTVLAFPIMMRGSSVPDSNHGPVDDPPAKDSQVVKPLRVSLKFLAAYSVAFVNGAAVLYILFRIVLSGVRRFLDAF